MKIPSFSTFGDLLKYLRRRAQITQRELAIAVGYTEGHISRLEKNQRLPDLATVTALFIPALGLNQEPEAAGQLLQLAASAHGDQLRAAADVTISHVERTTEIRESAESTPSNLPIQLTTFIGRQAEMAEIKALLSRDNPPGLVTLTGPGGIGKTRLALQITMESLHLYPDGVWFIDLAPLYTPELVLQAIASTLKITEAGTPSIEESLIAYLHSKQVLVLIDNCEHLIDAAAQAAEKILRSCAQVQILATSREPLKIPGEVNFRVPPLSLPEGQESTRQTVMGHESIQLFIERAQNIHQTFTITDSNASMIARICRQLDGMPLAIELAAARLTVLDVQQIAVRLDDRFNLLTGGSRTALPRHQTLRATIAWSYELLSEQEKVVLHRLSLFAGGWTLEAAEAVCSEQRSVNRKKGHSFVDHKTRPMENVLDLLDHLVNKSLVVTERQPAAEIRYRMLETVRHYAFEKLVESGEEEQVRNCHREFFLSMAEQAAPELRGHRQIEWLNRLGSEHDNLRAILDWSLEQKDIQVTLRLTGALFPFWHIRGYASEGRRWIEAALMAGPNMIAWKDSPLRAKALLGHGMLTYLQGHRLTARASLEESLRIFRTVGDNIGVGHVLHRLAAIPFWDGDFATARALYEESLSILRQAGDAWGIGNSLYGLARLAQRRGDFRLSYSLFEESVDLLRQVGDRQSLTRPLEYLAWEVWYRGDLPRAQALLEESLSLYRALGAKSGLAHTLGWLSTMTMARGNFTLATALEEQALAFARELGRKQDIAWSLGRLGELHCGQGDFALAQACYAESRQLLEEINDHAGIGWVLRLLGRLAYHQGDYRQSAALLNKSLALHEEAGDEPFIFLTLLYLGDLSRLQGDDDLAAQHYRRSLQIHRKRDAKVQVANRLEGLAKVARQEGHLIRAARLFAAAQVLRDLFGMPQIPVEQADHEVNLAAVRDALGEKAFSVAWAEGKEMTLEQAVEYALAPSTE